MPDELLLQLLEKTKEEIQKIRAENQMLAKKVEELQAKSPTTRG